MSCQYNNQLYTTIPEKDSLEYSEEIFDYHYAVDPTPTDTELEEEYREIYPEVIL